MPQKKLSQVLAIEKTTKNKVENEFTRIYQIIGKQELVNGFQKNYTPLEENGQKLPPENKKVQFRAADQIKQVKKELTELLDLGAMKEKTNCLAKADIEVDGKVIAKDVPATYLLYLEHKLQDLATFVKKLPVLDTSEDWLPDPANGMWKTNAFEAVRTKKVEEHQVIVPPTKEHPAQVTKLVKDVPEGKWSTVKYSGAVPLQEIESMAERVEKLQRAVKSARAEANTVVVDETLKPGNEILSYIFG